MKNDKILLDLARELADARTELRAARAEVAHLEHVIHTIYAERAAEIRELQDRDAIQRSNHERELADCRAEIARGVA